MYNPLEVFVINDIYNIYLLNKYIKLNSIILTIITNIYIINIILVYKKYIIYNSFSNKLYITLYSYIFIYFIYLFI